MTQARKLSRRDFLRLVASTATGTLVAACAPATPEVIEVVGEATVEEVVTDTPVVQKEAQTEQVVTDTPIVEEETKAEEPAEPSETFVAKTADVPPGSSYDFRYKEKPAILVNLDGEYRAYVNVCPHNGCQTKYYGQTSLDCPCHGSRFEAATGEVLQGPALSPLRKIEVLTEEDSVYYVA